MKLPKKLAAGAATLGLVIAGFAAGVAPAQAFSSSSSITSGGVTYKANATSCNVYVRSCSWSTSGSLSSAKTYTHTSNVKANGIGVTVSISKNPGATLTGNSTTMATSKKTAYGSYSSNNGEASPSLLSVSVAARSTMSAGGHSAQTGWTTW